MKNRFRVIYGKQGNRTAPETARPLKRKTKEPDLEILNQSPCIKCEVYVEDTICQHSREGCSKIDAFQQVAAVHCTLYKDQDIFSILKI